MGRRLVHLTLLLKTVSVFSDIISRVCSLYETKKIINPPVSAQVSTAGSGGLLGSASSLPLGFGMLGGLVPVSLPFQFPPLLNLPPLGTAGSSTAASGSAASSNASFSTLTQSE